MNHQKYIKTVSDELAVRQGCYIDLAAAEKVRNFFQKILRHSKGIWAGKKFQLLDWQWENVILPLFGWMRPDGSRRFRQAYIEVPKKNGKSEICAGFALYGLLADGESGSEIYCAAADRDQASIVFNIARDMVRQSPALTDKLEVIDSRKTIVHHASHSIYRALSREFTTKEGINTHFLIFDELHIQKTPDLWNTLYYSFIARRQPLLIAITTAGEERTGICWEQHEYAEKIRDGIIEDISFFQYMRSADPEKMQSDPRYWTLPKTWKEANPSLGQIMSIESMAEDCKKAQEIPRLRAEFLRYRLNIWGEKDDKWLSMEKWDACAGDGTWISVDKTIQKCEKLTGKMCYAGLDLASSIDIAALTLVFPVEEDLMVWLPFFWTPEERAHEREHKDRVPYLTWARQGWIELTEGNVIDYDVIRKRINELNVIYKIEEIAIDRWNSTQLQTQLAGDGFTIIPFGQGFASMSAPSKEFERRILEKTLIHGGNPVLRWMASNLCVRTDAAGNLKPDKEKSPEKIDGIVAGIMGLDRATRRPNDSVYTDRGVLVI